MTGVLVDTSVWIQHFRDGNRALVGLLAADRVLSHPLVLGEIACGTPPQRKRTLADMAALQPAQQPNLAEVIAFIERGALYGLGCGIVDLVLLASVLMTSGAELWTNDKRLSALAERYSIRYMPTGS